MFASFELFLSSGDKIEEESELPFYHFNYKDNQVFHMTLLFTEKNLFYLTVM